MIEELLTRARVGGAILFCGAGFSGDCLSHSDEEAIGASESLLDALNDAIQDNAGGRFRDIKNAADKFIELRGEVGLLSFMQQRFNLSRVTDDLVDITTYPWDKIYTTNYDNAIELCLDKAKIRHRSYNSIEGPDDIPGIGLEVVHLHGSLAKWNIHNFKMSCVLGFRSYLSAPTALERWLDQIRDDLARASIICFVGFSANDFHLNEVIYNVEGVKGKSFFINRANAILDVDQRAVQANFGTPLSIGRLGLAELIRTTSTQDAPATPHTPSFFRYVRPKATLKPPGVDAIENLLIFGNIDSEYLARDITFNVSEYHVQRQVTRDIVVEIENNTNNTNDWRHLRLQIAYR